MSDHPVSGNNAVKISLPAYFKCSTTYSIQNKVISILGFSCLYPQCSSTTLTSQYHFPLTFYHTHMHACAHTHTHTHTHTVGHTHGPCFYAQEDFNKKIDDIQEKLDDLKLEQAKYNQSKEIKTKQIVRYLILNTIVIACIL